MCFSMGGGARTDLKPSTKPAYALDDAWKEVAVTTSPVPKVRKTPAASSGPTPQTSSTRPKVPKGTTYSGLRVPGMM